MADTDDPIPFFTDNKAAQDASALFGAPVGNGHDFFYGVVPPTTAPASQPFSTTQQSQQQPPALATAASTHPATFFDQPQSSAIAQNPVSFFDTLGVSGAQPSTTSSQQGTQQDSVLAQPQANSAVADSATPSSYTHYEQQYDSNVQAQHYDPSTQQYDSNSQQYDPNAYYDQNNANQQYDYNQYGYSAEHQYAGYDYSQYDPNAAYDPNYAAYYAQQAYDPNTQSYYQHQAYDPNQVYDSNQAYDPNQLYDPSQTYDQQQQYNTNLSAAYDSYQQYSQSTGTAEYPDQQYPQQPVSSSLDGADIGKESLPPTSLSTDLASDLIPSLEKSVESGAFDLTGEGLIESERVDGVVQVVPGQQQGEGVPVLAVAQVEAAVEEVEEPTGRELDAMAAAEAQRATSPRQITGEEISIVQNFANDQDYYQYDARTAVVPSVSAVAVVPVVAHPTPVSAATPEQAVPATPEEFEEEVAMLVPTDEKAGEEETTVVEKRETGDGVDDLDDLVLGGGDVQEKLEESTTIDEKQGALTTQHVSESGKGGPDYDYSGYQEYNAFGQHAQAAEQQQDSHASWYDTQNVKMKASQPPVTKKDDAGKQNGARESEHPEEQGAEMHYNQDWYGNQTEHTTQGTGDSESGDTAAPATWYKEYGGYGSDYGVLPEQPVQAAGADDRETVLESATNEQSHQTPEGDAKSSAYEGYGNYSQYGAEYAQYDPSGANSYYDQYQYSTNEIAANEGGQQGTQQEQQGYSEYQTSDAGYGAGYGYSQENGAGANVEEQGYGDATGYGSPLEHQQAHGYYADAKYSYPEQSYNTMVSESTTTASTAGTVATPLPPGVITSPFGTHVNGNSTAVFPPKRDSIGSSISSSFQLLPCPHPGCAGEHKPNDKFCPECGGRILTSSSRSGTPSINLSTVAEVAVGAVTVGALATAAGSQSPHNQYGHSPRGNNVYLPSPNYTGNKHPSRSTTPLSQVSLSATQSPGGGYIPHQDATYLPDTSADQYSSYLSEEPESASADTWSAVNDPLSRSHGCPLATFGFGGKLFVMFPHRVQRFQTSPYGAAAGRLQQPIVKTVPGSILVKNIKDLLAKDAQHVALTSFPGPLLADNKGGLKQKRKDVSKFLDTRIAEEQGKIQSSLEGTVDRRRAEASVLLWMLLRIVNDNDGLITGSPKVDESIRDLLVPQKNVQIENDMTSFTVPADQKLTIQPEDYTTDSDPSRILDKLQDLLLKGDRSAAVRYAIQEDLWSHALIISSCVNKEMWREVVSEFAHRELAGDVVPGQTIKKAVQGDREALRVLYALFAGLGRAAVQEFLAATPSFLHQNSSPVGHTPIAFNHTAQQAFRDAPVDKLSKWRDTLALILANRTPKDHDAITALGDLLREHGWTEAAHICYLLSPQSSILSGLDTPQVRLILVGIDQFRRVGDFYHDLDSIYRTELWEFALSGKTAAVTSGMPFLQPYKLVHAWWLADHGLVQEAQRYCEAMANIIKSYTKGSPYFHKHFLEKLKELNDFIEMSGVTAGGADSATSWLTTKLPKPTLDSIWGSLEGKFSKFVSGEDTANAEVESRPSTEILASPSSENPPARSVSANDFRMSRNSMGIDAARRAVTPSGTMTGNQGSRSSSPGMGFGFFGFGQAATTAPEASTGPSGVNAMPPVQEGEGEYASTYNGTNNWGGYQANSYNANGYGQANADYGNPQSSYGYGSGYEADGSSTGGSASRRGMFSPFGNSTPGYQSNVTGYAGGSNWWDNSVTASDTQQEPTDDLTNNPDYDASNFVSPMGSVTTPTPAQQQSQARTSTWEDNDDDLGFGNSALKKKEPVEVQEQDHNGETKKPINDNTSGNDTKESSEAKDVQADQKGWGFMSFFSRKGAATENKNKQANLGEESSFYFDEKEKRWVNKKAGDTSSTPTPPPAPPKASSRPETPTNSLSVNPSPLGPSRSTTLGSTLSPPPVGPARTASAPISGPSPFGAGPPFNNAAALSGTRSSSTTGSRSRARARYVDVLGQQQSG